MKLTQKRAAVNKRVLIYGAPKTGKSLIVGKLAEYYNLIWFDNEQGWDVLLQLPTEWQERINIISVPDSKLFPIAVETWLKIVKGTKTDICVQHGKVSCALCKKDNKSIDTVQLDITPANTIVVFDSLTQLTASMVSHITKSQPDDYKMQLDDWGNLKFLMDKFLSQIQAAGYNVVCITHEEMVPMEDGKFKLVPSSGSAKSSMFTAKYFSDVVYAEVVNKKHRFGSSTDYSMNAIAGSRTGIAMEKAVVPTLLDIFTSWKDTGFSSGSSSIEDVSVGEVSSNEEGSADLLQSIPAPAPIPLTPSQIALANLRNRK